uniref:Uncharacterized protein n=1 Tax=Pinguiococcus pyrenoidosus TaxID=172671 RepID=A0A7R9UE56_9STRA
MEPYGEHEPGGGAAQGRNYSGGFHRQPRDAYRPRRPNHGWGRGRGRGRGRRGRGGSHRREPEAPRVDPEEEYRNQLKKIFRSLCNFASRPDFSSLQLAGDAESLADHLARDHVETNPEFVRDLILHFATNAAVEVPAMVALTSHIFYSNAGFGASVVSAAVEQLMKHLAAGDAPRCRCLIRFLVEAAVCDVVKTSGEESVESLLELLVLVAEAQTGIVEADEALDSVSGAAARRAATSLVLWALLCGLRHLLFRIGLTAIRSWLDRLREALAAIESQRLPIVKKTNGFGAGSMRQIVMGRLLPDDIFGQQEDAEEQQEGMEAGTGADADTDADTDADAGAGAGAGAGADADAQGPPGASVERCTLVQLFEVVNELLDKAETAGVADDAEVDDEILEDLQKAALPGDCPVLLRPWRYTLKDFRASSQEAIATAADMEQNGENGDDGENGENGSGEGKDWAAGTDQGAGDAEAGSALAGANAEEAQTEEAEPATSPAEQGGDGNGVAGDGQGNGGGGGEAEGAEGNGGEDAEGNGQDTAGDMDTEAAASPTVHIPAVPQALPLEAEAFFRCFLACWADYRGLTPWTVSCVDPIFAFDEFSMQEAVGERLASMPASSLIPTQLLARDVLAIQMPQPKWDGRIKGSFAGLAAQLLCLPLHALPDPDQDGEDETLDLEDDEAPVDKTLRDAVCAGILRSMFGILLTLPSPLHVGQQTQGWSGPESSGCIHRVLLSMCRAKDANDGGVTLHRDMEDVKIAPLLASAICSVNQQVPVLSPTAVDALSGLFAFHVGNTNLNWPFWNEFSAVLQAPGPNAARPLADDLPAVAWILSCSESFVKRLIRLLADRTHVQKVRQKLPEEVAALLSEDPEEAAAVDETDGNATAARDLAARIKDRQSTGSVYDSLSTRMTDLAAEDMSRIIAQAIRFESISMTHGRQALAYLKPLLDRFFEDAEEGRFRSTAAAGAPEGEPEGESASDARVAFVQGLYKSFGKSVMEVSPIIEVLLRTHVLECGDVLRWAMQVVADGASEYRIPDEEFAAFELLGLSLSVLVDKIVGYSEKLVTMVADQLKEAEATPDTIAGLGDDKEAFDAILDEAADATKMLEKFGQLLQQGKIPMEKAKWRSMMHERLVLMVLPLLRCNGQNGLDLKAVLTSMAPADVSKYEEQVFETLNALLEGLTHFSYGEGG